MIFKLGINPDLQLTNLDPQRCYVIFRYYAAQFIEYDHLCRSPDSVKLLFRSLCISNLTRIRIRIGLAPWDRIWILIRIEEKSWIRIRIETNADPKHWL